MKKFLVLAAFLTLLPGCASIFGQDDWEPSGHVTMNSSLGLVALYRSNLNEKPAIERVEVAEGKFADVRVWAYRCAGNDTSTAYTIGHDIYLCDKAAFRTHEIAHVKGMKHAPWINTGVAQCATVTAAGFETGYSLGDSICVANEHEWKEAKHL